MPFFINLTVKRHLLSGLAIVPAGLGLKNSSFGCLFSRMALCLVNSSTKSNGAEMNFLRRSMNGAFGCGEKVLID